MTLLIGFTGQGSQYPGMFNHLKLDEFGLQWLTEASELLGLNLLDEHIIRKHCFDVLYSQLFIALLSVGAFRSIQASLPSQVLLCGYSLGEVAAFCASAQIPLDKMIELIKQRVNCMIEAAGNKPAGLTVLKGNINLVSASALAHQFNCHLAIIINSDHVVIGGLNENMDLLINEAHSQGILKIERLPIQLPSHTPILQTATVNFSSYLQTECQNYTMSYPILNALTVTMISATSEMLPVLANELSHTLHWNKLMHIAEEYNMDRFLDLGPKSTLKNMFSRVNPAMRTYALDDFDKVSGLRTILR